MNLLAIDTSTRAQVLGLRAGDRLIDGTGIVGREHARKVLPGIVDLLAEAGLEKSDLDAIVYGKGPGSFTGLRIAVGVVQGLAYGLGIPVVPVSTLACLAQGAWRRTGETNVVVALAARKEEVFFGSYRIENGIATEVGPEGVFEASEIPTQPFDRCAGVGDGWQFAGQLQEAGGIVAEQIAVDVLPEVHDLLVLGEYGVEQGKAVTAREAHPEYLREQVATPPGRRE